MTWHSIKRWGSSLLVVGAGITTLLVGLQYPLGTLSAMGPGHFPVTLGVLLIFLGALTGLLPDEAAEAEEGEASVNRWDLRGPVSVVLALVLFVVIGEHAGLAPAAFVLVFVSALADRRNSVGFAALLAFAVTLAGLMLFSKVLQGRLPLFMWS